MMISFEVSLKNLNEIIAEVFGHGLSWWHDIVVTADDPLTLSVSYFEDPDDDTAAPKTTTVTLDDLSRATQLYLNRGSKSIFGEDESIPNVAGEPYLADEWLQLAVFGAVIYG